MIRQNFRPDYLRAARRPPGSAGAGPGDPGGGGGEEDRVMGPNAVASLVNGMELDDRVWVGSFWHRWELSTASSRGPLVTCRWARTYEEPLLSVTHIPMGMGKHRD